MLAPAPSGRLSRPETLSFQRELDCSLYFHDSAGRLHKHQTGKAAPHVDPSKPTLIYVHGWEINRVSTGWRESFDYGLSDAMSSARLARTQGGALGHTALSWLEQGWNVGIFYWDNFADERAVADAEAKIWTAHGPRRMRYRLGDGRWHEADAQATDGRSIGERLADALADALAGPCGESGRPDPARGAEDAGTRAASDGQSACGTVRLAGHSLGAQLVVHAAALLLERARAGTVRAELVPSRLALLDPYHPVQLPLISPQRWLTPAVSAALGGGRTTEELCAKRASALADHGVVLERYVSSLLPDLPAVVSAQPRLTTAVPTVRFDVSAWTRSTDFQARHLACPALYFASHRLGHQSAHVGRDGGNSLLPDVVPSAALSDGELAVLQPWVRWRAKQDETIPRLDGVCVPPAAVSAQQARAAAAAVPIGAAAAWRQLPGTWPSSTAPLRFVRSR